MLILNNVELIGTLVQTPQRLMTRNNKPYIKALIAQTETYNGNDGQEHSKTNYYPITAFGIKAMDKLMTARRGMTVCIQGTLTSNPYDRKDGTKDYGININALAVSLDGEGALSPEPVNVNKVDPSPFYDSDPLPF